MSLEEDAIGEVAAGEERDRLPAAAVADADLPADVKASLTDSGVPHDLRLPCWLGPTLFTSALGSGALRSVDDSGQELSLARPLAGPVDAYVLGTSRETQGGSWDYAVFCVVRASGRVVLVDNKKVQFVNTTVGQFLEALGLFYEWWPRWLDVPLDAVGLLDAAAGVAAVAELRAGLLGIDASALADDDTYWSDWFWELEGNLPKWMRG